MTTIEKRRALGRGLDALLPDVPAALASVPASASDTMFSCPLERIAPQSGQPRQHFEDARIEELAQSIREHGVLEPLVVRRLPRDGGGIDRFEIVAGERRWRAAQRAGLREVLVVVKDVSPSEAFELALIENVQREDLNPLELAEALDRLIREHSYTQEALAARIGKDRTTIANSLRLLKLPARVRQLIIDGALSEGHARALLGATGAAAIEGLAERVVRGALSVRETERLVRGVKKPQRDEQPDRNKKSASVRDLEQRLARHLGTKVEVLDDGGKGRLAIHYGSLDELDRILDAILR
jgi:ParB family chromosome partitioning protein